MTSPILTVRNLEKRFGGLAAVGGVDFDVHPGQIKALIGPNGAGKTTIFNMVAGSFKPSAGSIVFGNREISRLDTHRIAPLGIARTFQNVKIFRNMTALQNVMLGMHCRLHSGFLGAAFRTPATIREERHCREKALEWLSFIGLSHLAETNAASIAFGNQKVLEIARALATEPKLLLLDEPAAGLNTRETEDVARLIQRIRDLGITVLLVEHDMSLVMEISDEVIVLHTGMKIAEGKPRDVQNNPEVVRVYLGQDFNGTN